jgi:uncharacterized protein YecT (DUF1311 family)
MFTECSLKLSKSSNGTLWPQVLLQALLEHGRLRVDQLLEYTAGK